MGKTIVTFADYDAETSTAQFPGSDLTAANIVAEEAEILALRNALNAVVLGLELAYTVQAKTSPQAVGRASDPQAQREAKAIVRYYDVITFGRGSLTLPCVDLDKQHPNYPGTFYRAGDGANHADWDTFATAFETYVPGPGGNICQISEIVHVGRNT